MNTTARHAAALDRLHTLQIETILAGADMAAQASRFTRLRDRHQNGTAPRAVSAFQLFQTPPDLAARLVGLLNLRPGARVLEPSAGLGRILDALRPHGPAEVVAVEIAPSLCAELYKQDRAGVELLQRDFLTLPPDALGTFDAVAMNPPFHLRADIRHTLHALRFLRPGGRLAGLCMDTRHRAEALRPLCDHWEPIHAGAFRAEGTGVPTVLFSLTA